MASLFYIEPELVIAQGRRIIFVNPNDLQIFKEVEVPEKLDKCESINNNDSGIAQEQLGDDEAKSEKQESEKASTKLEAAVIQQVQLSPDRNLLAVTTSGQKALLLYKCFPVHAKLISVRTLSRTSSAITFTNDSKAILVTDKSGDCYIYDCVDLEAKPRLLLGHLSILYGVLWTPDSRFIITCDRDDKIRVTNYPETYDIYGYCLGHKEFVSGIRLLEQPIIVSISGDKTMRIWNYETCCELACCEMPAAGIHFDVKKLGENTYRAVVLFYLHEKTIGIYDMEKRVELDSWHIQEKTQVAVEGIDACNICFADNRLYIAGIEDGRLRLRLAPLEGAELAPNNWIEMVEDYFKDVSCQPEDVSTWFKRKYDNLSEYLDRKKRRIEEKQK